MNSIRDKLIEIAKKCIADKSDNKQRKYGRVLIDCDDFDHACAAIADKFIEKLPELLDSELVKWLSRDEYRELQNQLAVTTRALEDMCKEFDEYIDCPYHESDCTMNEPCYLCTVESRLADAEYKEKLAKAKENDNE